MSYIFYGFWKFLLIFGMCCFLLVKVHVCGDMHPHTYPHEYLDVLTFRGVATCILSLSNMLPTHHLKSTLVYTRNPKFYIVFFILPTKIDHFIENDMIIPTFLIIDNLLLLFCCHYKRRVRLLEIEPSVCVYECVCECEF